MENKINFNWEKGYYVGQEYVEDSDRIEVIIHLAFYFPAIFNFNNFEIEKDNAVKMKQLGGLFVVEFEKQISKKLFNDLQTLRSPSDPAIFILGYIDEILPILNQKIITKKYLSGHILARPIGILDIQSIQIIDKETSETVYVNWPKSVTGFPISVQLAPKCDFIFIRDLIDAMTLYFNYNLDECIRKIITSLENCFRHYKLMSLNKNWIDKIISKFLPHFRPKFKQIVNTYITEPYYPYKEKYLKILRENILFVYHVRNKIVHDKLRMKFENRWFCKKAIGTLLYIYQGSFIDKTTREYIFSLYQQFLLLDMQFLRGLNLEEIKRTKKEIEKLEKTPAKFQERIIKNKEDLDNFIFSGLRIANNEKIKITWLGQQKIRRDL
jgi:hypothetical protein